MILRRFPPFESAARPHEFNNGREGGYLLVGVGIALLVIAGLISVIAFETSRQSRAKGFYNLGAQFADLAVAAHSVAQNSFYANATAVGGYNFFNATDLPEFANRFNMSLYGATFQVEVRGVDAAPMDAATPLADKAASGILYLHPITSMGQGMLAIDAEAFVSGAQARGMPGVGIVGAVFQPGDDVCDAQPTVVRWGSGDTACFNQLQLSNAGIVAPQPGDLIAPAWEAAITRLDQRAVMRFPQPGRPDLTQMTTALDMSFGPITNLGVVDTQNLIVQNTSSPENLVVTGATTTQFADATSVNAPTLTVNGTTGTGGLVATTNAAATTINNAASMQTHNSATLQTTGNLTLTGTIAGDMFSFGACDAATGVCPP